MPTDGYHGITVEKDTYEKLEAERKRLGLRSIADVVRYYTTLFEAGQMATGLATQMKAAKEEVKVIA
jgi:predicted CopG family antitoxin